MNPAASAPIVKLASGMPGVDLVTHGGVPRARTTLVAGTAGSAKTVFAVHFLAAGAAAGEAGVFVTLEERPDDIRSHARSLGFDIAGLEAEGRWRFVDAAPNPQVEAEVFGEYDLAGLLARVRHAVTTTGANVIVLRNVLEDGQRRRTLEVLKMRGTSHQRGEYPFSVIDGSGLAVLPLTAIDIRQRSTDERISSGIDVLDSLCNGGWFRDSMVLVSGPTGAGKTLTATHFLAGGIAAGERCLAFSFEESQEQLHRNARGWGVDYAAAEDQGLLQIFSAFPESAGLEDHLIRMKDAIDTFRPRRITVDSLSALERGATTKAFREVVIGLSAYIKQEEIAGLFTVTTSDLSGGATITDSHISTITDVVVLLRYVEAGSEIRRAMTVLKMRGSAHDKAVREFHIDASGLHIGEPVAGMRGFLTGDLSTPSA